MYVYQVCARCLQRPGEGVRVPRTGVHRWLGAAIWVLVIELGSWKSNKLRHVCSPFFLNYFLFHFLVCLYVHLCCPAFLVVSRCPCVELVHGCNHDLFVLSGFTFEQRR